MRASGRGSAFVLACALIAVGCGGRTALSNYSVSGSGSSAAVGGSVGAGGVPAGTGGAFGGGGTIGSSGGTGGGGGQPMCKPGERLTILEVTAVCEPCPEGTFSTIYQTTTCEPWTECAWEEQEVVHPTSKYDRVCEYASPTRQFGITDDDVAYDVIVDERGFVFVSGGTYGSLDGTSGGNADVFVREYAPSGDLVWGRQIPGEGYDTGGRLALGYGSLPFVLTNRWGADDGDSAIWTVSKYAANLVQVFGADGTDFALNPDASILFTRSAVGSNGYYSVMRAEYSSVGLYQSNLWTVESADFVYPADLELLNDGTFVVTGSTNGPLFRPNTGVQEVFVARYSQIGALHWGVQFGDTYSAQPRALAVDSHGDVYIVGTSAGANGQGSAPMAAKVSASGTLLWMTQLGPADTTLDLTDVAIDSADRVFVAGAVFGAFGATYYGNQDAVVFQLYSDGSLGPVHQFGTAQDDWAAALACAPDGAVFVVGGTAGTLGAASFGSLDGFATRVPIETFY